METPEPERTRWPEHLRVGALRVVRWSTHYDQTVIFYRDIIGLPVLETFRGSYGLDGTILGLPDGPATWRLSVWPAHGRCPLGWISWCSTCLMPAPRSRSRHGWPLRAWTRLRRLTTGTTTEASPTRTQTGGK